MWFGNETVNRSIAWPYAVLCMRVLSQPCSQAPCPASHHWKVRLVLRGSGTSCPGRRHLVLGPRGGTASPRTTCLGGQLVRGDTWSSYIGILLNREMPCLGTLLSVFSQARLHL